MSTCAMGALDRADDFQPVCARVLEQPTTPRLSSRRSSYDASGAVVGTQSLLTDLLALSEAPQVAPAVGPRIEQPGDRDPLDCAWISLPQPAGWQKRAADKTPEESLELSRRGLALSAGQRMSRNQKLDFSLRVIDRALRETPAWAVSFSAGRDSTVLSYLIVEVMGHTIPHVMSNTRMEQAETMRQAARWRTWLEERGSSLHLVYPDQRPGEVWADGLPLFDKGIASKARQYLATGNANHLLQVPESFRPAVEALAANGIALSEKCCDALKKEPLHAWDADHGIQGHFTGLRAEESQDRRMGYIQRGALYHSTRHRQWLSTPLIHWTRADIDSFLEEKKIAPEYTGRTGCVTCMFGAHIAERNGDENSLQKLHRDNPKLWLQALDAWGYRKALDVLHIAYRRQVAVPEQETLWSEAGIGAKDPAQAENTYIPGPGTRAIDALGARAFGEHLVRLIDRAEAVEQLDRWQTTSELVRAWHIPTARLVPFIQARVADHTWMMRHEFDTAVDGFGLIPEFRPVSVMEQALALDAVAVAADQERRYQAAVNRPVRPRRHAESGQRQLVDIV